MRGPQDAAFTSADMEVATALQELEQMTCSGCGQDRTKSMSPEGEFLYRSEILRCHGCATRAKSLEKYAESGGNTEGVTAVLTEKEL